MLDKDEIMLEPIHSQNYPCLQFAHVVPAASLILIPVFLSFNPWSFTPQKGQFSRLVIPNDIRGKKSQSFDAQLARCTVLNMLA